MRRCKHRSSLYSATEPLTEGTVRDFHRFTEGRAGNAPSKFPWRTQRQSKAAEVTSAYNEMMDSTTRVT